MKKISLLCTSLPMYLTELPIIYLLYLSIKHNATTESTFKLYPLIFGLSAIIIFIFVYLFRVIVLSYDAVMSIGPYSSREKALITEGKTLVLSVAKHRKTKVELFGYDEKPPMLDWAVDEDYTNIEVNLFRERMRGTRGPVKKILRYFEVPAEDIEEIFSEDSFTKVYEYFDLTSTRRNELREIKIKFTKTV